MKINKGFSLAEMLTVLIIIVVFVAASAPIFTKKYIKPASSVPHGRFECYRTSYNGTIYQKLIVEDQVGTPTPVASYCTFHPDPKVTYYMVSIVGGGGGGLSAVGGRAGEYKTMFFPSLKDPVTMTPGTGGAAYAGLTGYAGGTTSFDGTNLTAIGGQPVYANVYLDLLNTSSSGTGSCSVVYNPYQSSYCTGGKVPSCTYYGTGFNYFVVNDCRSTSAKSFSSFSYVSGTTYLYSSPAYKISVVRKIVNEKPYYSAFGETSKFQDYLTTSGYTDFGTGTLTPGKGGEKAQAGSAGAIIIVW